MTIAEAKLRIRSALVVIAHAGQIARIARRVVREASTVIYVQARIRLQQQLAATRVVNPVATRSAPASEADKGATVPSPLLPGIPAGPASPHFSAAPDPTSSISRPHCTRPAMVVDGDGVPTVVHEVVFLDGPPGGNAATPAIYALPKRRAFPHS